MSTGSKVLILRFTVPEHLADAEIHDIGERIVTGLVTDEPVTFDRTEVVDERPEPDWWGTGSIDPGGP